MYVDEIFSGLDYANFPKITVIENKMKVDEMVTVRDITLTSTCEHHFVTIDGKATVAYIPKDSVIGLSKINRIVQFFSQRPQVQERLTQQILVALQTLLGTNNVAVSIDAVHYCVKARGIRDATSATTTTLGAVQVQPEYPPGVPARGASSPGVMALRATRTTTTGACGRLFHERKTAIKMNSHPLPRIATLDCVRGIAILGILLLNISAFGLPKAAYLNPAYLGMPSSRDAWTGAARSLRAGEVLAMFALLFGAGLQMLLRRGKSWIRARLSWLVLFGLAHAIFLWDGDILLAYGLIGLVCWRMIREAKETFQLLKTGVVLYLIGVAVLLLLGSRTVSRAISGSRAWRSCSTRSSGSCRAVSKPGAAAPICSRPACWPSALSMAGSWRG